MDWIASFAADNVISSTAISATPHFE